MKSIYGNKIVGILSGMWTTLLECGIQLAVNISLASMQMLQIQYCLLEVGLLKYLIKMRTKGAVKNEHAIDDSGQQWAMSAHSNKL